MTYQVFESKFQCELCVRFVSQSFSVSRVSGVQVIENCSVTRVSTEDGKVSRVDTNIGNIKCEVFVNCAGIVSRPLPQAQISGTEQSITTELVRPSAL